MRIAFLCKRQYTGHDVISDRYGRLYEIPLHLARMGHSVRSYCMDYHHRENSGTWSHRAPTGELHWESQGLGRLGLPTLLGYPARVLGRLRSFQPDLVIGASDIPHVALAAWLAGKLHVPCALDLYDNFESFGQARIPGFPAALRWAVRKADLLIAVSQGLRRFVEESYRPDAPILVMGNSLDTSLFHPRDRAAARASFGLPMDEKLIGTAGSLYLEKGFAPLCAAWERVAATRGDVRLVLRMRPDADSGLAVADERHVLLRQIGAEDPIDEALFAVGGHRFGMVLHLAQDPDLDVGGRDALVFEAVPHVLGVAEGSEKPDDDLLFHGGLRW